ncbi:ras and Rab interactor 3-like isoform X2 [Mixophyes fleayi]|uniref:ras and Rab interactor 3-like isoform X2 n=1 Tax=Mixophyes fleayi TaxID=3061075 RepID=UPI003F4DAD14
MKLNLPQSNQEGQPFCSVRVTSENGALCIINPLFLHEHGDTWLSHVSQSQVAEKRKSVPWCFGEDLNKISHGTALEDINGHYNNTDEQSNTCETSSIEGSDSFIHQEKTVTECCEGQNNSDSRIENSKLLRKPVVRTRKASNINTNVTISISQTVDEGFGDNNQTLWQSREKRHPFAPHRVTWIEQDHVSETTLKKSNSESSLNSSDSFLLPPLPELDSVSISSVEEEECSSMRHKRKHSHGLGDMVRHSLLAVSTVLTGLVSPEKHLVNRIQQLAEDPLSFLGGTVQTFICHFQKGTVQYQYSTEMLQAIRQLITNLKNYLLDSNEIWEIVEHQDIEDFKIASIIETSLYKCVLKPLQDAIYSQLLDLHNRDGSLDNLLGNQQKMKSWSHTDQKPRAGLPGPGTIEKIQQKLSLMHMAYSPEKKIRHLLKVCKIIYESMETSSGKKAFGADDFLPVLIHVLLGCDLTSVLLDVEYMMELVDPSQLQGEGGYYLTTLFGALYHIGSFNTVSRQLSVEAQNSIRQWQRRRTIQRKHTFNKRVQVNKETSEKRISGGL